VFFALMLFLCHLLLVQVLEQAYFYRMESSVQLDQVPEINTPSTSNSPVPTTKFNEFCQSMLEIENLRIAQADKLKQALAVDELPPVTNDPVLLPFINSTIRKAVETFSMAANDIVQKYDLKSDEFNHLLQRTKRNPFFLWKVQRQIGTTER
jgi:Domain of unknown function (DUF4168)